MNKNICQLVTDNIISQLDSGYIPWKRPWKASAEAASHASGKKYSFLNQMLLNGCGEWITLKQINKEGGTLKEGATPSQIVFWSMVPERKKDDNGVEIPEELRGYYPCLRCYNVYEMGSVEGIERKTPEDLQMPNTAKTIDEIEKMWRDYAAREALPVNDVDISQEAFYSPSGDYIRVPRLDQFYTTEGRYSTLFHELGHSTGHPKRLNRGNKSKRAGDREYAREELVAEMTAAILCARLGIDTEDGLKNRAAYIQHWRNQIAEDNELVIIAAGRAQKAAELILGEPL